MLLRLLLFGTLLLVAASACRSAEAGVSPGDRERFVEVNVALRGVAAEGGDDAAADREAVLAAHGVSEEWLLALSGRLAAHPDALSDTWDEIQRRLEWESAGEAGDAVGSGGIRAGSGLPLDEADAPPRIRGIGEAPAYVRPAPPRQPRSSPSFEEVPPAELAPQRPEEGLPGQPQ
jgi:hypothetical protein